MTENGRSEGFAARWSKLKTQARQDEAPAAENHHLAVEGNSAIVSESASPETGSEFPSLPPIETIDAKTDLAPWLAENVPSALRLAALRKMWAADPAISQFIGPSDYAWDWNVPDGVPGFGPLRAIDNVAKLMVEVVGTPPSSQESEEKKSAAIVETVMADRIIVPSESEALSLQFTEEKTLEFQNESARLPSGRRGGGALPS